MNIRRGLFRAWVFGSVIWVGYWIWLSTYGCSRSLEDSLYCPTGIGDWMAPISYMPLSFYNRVILIGIGLPMAVLLCGISCIWVARGFRR